MNPLKLRVFAGFLLVVALASPAALARAEELVPWDQAGDFGSVLTRAKKAKRLIFVDFYATWCGPCKMMDRTVYSDSLVARESARFINRKIDAEKGEGIALARDYRVTAYPTLLIVDASGNEMAREVGYRPADRFRMFLEDTRTGRGSITSIEKLIAKGSDSFENRIALGSKYLEAGRREDARAQYDRALALDATDPEGRAADLLVRIARSRSDGGDPAGAIADADAFLARFPSSSRRLEVLELKANAHAARAEKDSAVATWRLVLEGRGKEDPAALADFARFCATNGAALDEAFAAGTKAVELTQGKDATALDALAEVYSARGQYDEAVSTAERAVDANPGQGYLRGRLERFQELAVAAVRAKSH